jgi:hypothetical protein
MKLRYLFSFILASILLSCSTNTISIKNDKQGYLKSSVRLEIEFVKKFKLDSVSAPRPQYIQIFEIEGGMRYFTFLNKFNNSIYVYDYLTEAFIKKLSYSRSGTEAIQNMMGYHIKSWDSIYSYNKTLVQVVLANDKGSVLSRISLHGEKFDSKWFITHPQYLPKTVIPFIETQDELLLPGFYIAFIPKSIISSFNLIARINLKTKNVRFSYHYPNQLYGHDYNWPGWGFTDVFAELHPDGKHLIFSFPMSHDLYISDVNSEEYKKVYAGSNFAGIISSLNKRPKKTTGINSQEHFMHQDTYTAIKYDRYRNVYYRFLLNAISSESNYSNGLEKPITIIVMDKDFNYLGETCIGKANKEWCWQNAFVTKEGLNIEYIEKDIDEEYLILKIITIKNI